MPSIYALKPRFQALLRPLTTRLAAVGVTANHVTIAAALMSVVYGAAIAVTQGDRLLLLGLPVILFLRMALNAIDGMLAREFKQKSDLGLVLNELGDVAADAGLYLPFALIAGFDPPLVVILVVLAMATEFTGLLAIPLGKPRSYAGPFGKSDRAVFFGALAVVVAIGIAPGPWLAVALAGATLLSLATIINRAQAALRA